MNLKDKRILIISNIGCGPPYMGNRIRMKELLIQIKNLGYEIHFSGICLSDNEVKSVQPYINFWLTNFQRQKKTKTLQYFRKHIKALFEGLHFKKKERTLNYGLDDFFDDTWLDQALEIQKKYKFNRVFIPYIFNTKFFNVFDDTVIKILDTHDVFGNRNHVLKKLGIESFWFSTTEDEEKKALQRANRIIAIQNHEEEYFKKLVDEQIDVYTVGHFIDMQFLSIYPENLRTFGFIGSDNPLNMNAFIWFTENVLPLVKQTVSEFKFIVCGGICNKLKKSEDYVLLGEIDSIIDFYKVCSFTINPVQGGSGLKIKTVESLAFGRPVVSSSHGVAGLESLIGSGVMAADDAVQFAEYIITCLTGSSELIRKMGNGINIIRNRHQNSLENLSTIMQA